MVHFLIYKILWTIKDFVIKENIKKTVAFNYITGFGDKISFKGLVKHTEKNKNRVTKTEEEIQIDNRMYGLKFVLCWAM